MQLFIYNFLKCVYIFKIISYLFIMDHSVVLNNDDKKSIQKANDRSTKKVYELYENVAMSEFNSPQKTPATIVNHHKMTSDFTLGSPQEPLNKIRFESADEIDCSDPMKLLDQATGAFIKQKVEMYEIVTGCETKNRYSISLKIKGWNKLYKAFKCKEESSWCMRNCCSGERREFKMNIKYSPNGLNDMGDDYSSQCFAELDRPYKCTFFNLNRPELTVKLCKEDKVIGTIIEPCSCSRVLLETKNENLETIYHFDVECAQPGIAWRAFTCGAIEKVEFPILKVDKKTGCSSVDGKILRLGRSYDEAVIGSDADNYDITFPERATAQEKFLILSTTMLIDFRYFEDTEEEESTLRRRNYYAK